MVRVTLGFLWCRGEGDPRFCCGVGVRVTLGFGVWG